MSFVTADISVSLDGYGAGPNQRLDAPFGDGILHESLHTWMFEHEAEHLAEKEAIVGADAYVMGRNMWRPQRGAHDPEWEGWWGDDPPYHAPVFVLTHHERAPVEKEGGTTFHFVTDGAEAAMARAKEVAGDGGRVSVAGGASTLNQYLALGAVDELRLHVVPIVVGAGSRIFDGLGGLELAPAGGRVTDHVAHLVFRRPGA